MSLLAAGIIGGAASSLASNIMSNSLSTSSTDHNALTASNYYKSNSLFQSELNRRDYHWQMGEDYQWANKEYYNLAKKYAENSASWSVQGLRNAGLNPILAATDGNFSSTYGSSAQNNQMSSSEASGNFPFASRRFDLTHLAQQMFDLANAKQAAAAAENAETSAEVNRGTTDAAKRKLNAEADLKEIEVKKAQETLHDQQLGYNSPLKFAMRSGERAAESIHDLRADRKLRDDVESHLRDELGGDYDMMMDAAKRYDTSPLNIDMKTFEPIMEPSEYKRRYGHGWDGLGTALDDLSEIRLEDGSAAKGYNQSSAKDEARKDSETPSRTRRSIGVMLR